MIKIHIRYNEIIMQEHTGKLKTDSKLYRLKLLLHDYIMKPAHKRPSTMSRLSHVLQYIWANELTSEVEFIVDNNRTYTFDLLCAQWYQYENTMLPHNIEGLKTTIETIDNRLDAISFYGTILNKDKEEYDSPIKGWSDIFFSARKWWEANGNS